MAFARKRACPRWQHGRLRQYIPPPPVPFQGAAGLKLSWPCRFLRLAALSPVLVTSVQIPDARPVQQAKPPAQHIMGLVMDVRDEAYALVDWMDAVWNLCQ